MALTFIAFSIVCQREVAVADVIHCRLHAVAVAAEMLDFNSFFS